jgi:hypothetical protein
MGDTTEATKAAAIANIGNTHSSKENRIWGNIIRKLAVQEDYKRLHAVANTLFEKAVEGDMTAIKEIGDRIDGKAVATTEISGPDGSAIPIGLPIEFIEPNTDSTVS